MSSIERFEDLDVWKSAWELSKQIYILSNKELFNKDFKLKDQIRGA